mmetsp:Transcript_1398/g.2558  ORF Transcript_1398/g.2558 Transcript_1398/m.2558 type:complete len:470 (+) Transcript_1398:154-1563(+)|eukprot:CAMPEP_0178690318 /NCGR_PEP_ID=MMETSP0699-20121125/6007_1 /TAXON_ID=265572 /ORGANISM="Extubocellulus spinifer, Strain CCMP396" /LENGTH=469 /DNA_ID=CAMNT_0020335439 /DNA_START=83 /DNA_END=1492 /DNA_ORIENTATION=-
MAVSVCRRLPTRRWSLQLISKLVAASLICLLSFEDTAAFTPCPSLAASTTLIRKTHHDLPTLHSTSTGRSSVNEGTPETSPYTRDVAATEAETIWERMALTIVPGSSENTLPTNPDDLKQFSQAVTLLRVGAPALLIAVGLSVLYTPTAIALANVIDDSGAFGVIAQDSSQYIQNILTTCGLMFSILAGQTFYFMYQQTEAVYVALYEEVTAAKSLLEQVSLVSQGRDYLNKRIILAIRKYVQEDLRALQDDPAVLLSSRPIDDPLESIMYLTSVGEPSVIYESVKALRSARAYRLGALQRKLPEIQMILLWSLAGVVLSTFPLLGAGVQTIGGMGILRVQSIYLTFIVFGIALTMGVISELTKPGGGAYNVDAVLNVMVGGLEEELDGRLKGKYRARIRSVGMDGDLTTAAATIGSDTTLSSEKVSVKYIEEDTTIIDTESASTVNGDAKKPWIGKRIARRIKNGKKK